MLKRAYKNANDFSAVELKPGEKGVISLIQGGDALRRRLYSLGMVKGASMVAGQRAPMGDPCSYKVLGYQISLRREEAERIILQPTT